MINEDSMRAFYERQSKSTHSFEYGLAFQESVQLVVRLYRPDSGYSLTLEITLKEKDLQNMVRPDWGRVLINNSERLNHIHVMHIVHRWPGI